MKIVNAFPWFGAVIFGALAPASIAAMSTGSIRFLPAAFAVALGHAIILGVPVAYVYRRRRWTAFLPAVVGGFLVGAIPFGIVSLPIGPTSETIDGVATVVDGVPTLEGWLKYAETLSVFGMFGVLGAVVFWLVLKVCGVFPAEGRDAAPSRLARLRFGIPLTGLAVLALAGIAAIPSMTKDRNCHNMFRDGRTTATTKVNIELDVSLDAWPAMTDLLRKFGVAHKMAFRDTSRSQPGVVEAMDISLCTEDGLNILALDQRWASRHYEPLIAGGGMNVGVYDLGSGSGWTPITHDLIAAFKAQWPGKVHFRDRGGHGMTEAEALKGP